MKTRGGVEDTRLKAKDTKNFEAKAKNRPSRAVVVLGMCKVCKCTGAPPLLGGPPFDLSRAEKFDYEKL